MTNDLPAWLRVKQAFCPWFPSAVCVCSEVQDR